MTSKKSFEVTLRHPLKLKAEGDLYFMLTTSIKDGAKKTYPIVTEKRPWKGISFGAMSIEEIKSLHGMMVEDRAMYAVGYILDKNSQRKGVFGPTRVNQLHIEQQKRGSLLFQVRQILGDKKSAQEAFESLKLWFENRNVESTLDLCSLEFPAVEA